MNTKSHRPIVPFQPLEICFLILIVLMATERSAQAYIDPGTGSMVLQILAGVLLAGLVTIKRWWRFVISLFKKKSDDDSSLEN